MWKRFIIGITLGMIMLVTAFAFDSNLEQENAHANREIEEDQTSLISAILEELKGYDGVEDIELNQLKSIIIHTSYDNQDPKLKDVLQTVEHVLETVDSNYDLEPVIYVQNKDGKVLK
ncbi:hypothetical protein ACERII_06080 [Evansella sp. AB-rgal1]|uniref:hypothetical protein n=1 Tax=Evansella sp. AB-rgal1 TaxID=3242696 RepID=UPI00359E9639